MPCQGCALYLLKAAGFLLALTTTAAAQDYPNRPVRVIVPFPAGGVNDTVGRLVAAQLSERLGKQFIVDNRTGAASVVGSEIAANAPKDGYTLLVVSIVNAVNPWLYKLPYDPVKAFTPVAFLATAPVVLVTNPELPVKSVKELLALAKSKPGEVPYATAGVGSFMHLGSELFKLMAGVDMLHVPFKGGGPAMVDVVAGHTKVAFATTITTSPFIRSGKLKGAGRGRAQAQRGAAGAADHRRVRRARLRRFQLDRHGGAGRHARRHRRQAAQGNRNRCSRPRRRRSSSRRAAPR